jgi:multidrug efflux pump subunit AcrA (membrane-fusion protein)
MGWLPPSRRTRAIVAASVTLVLLAGGAIAMTRWRGAPSLPTAEVKQGDYVDLVEIRGEIRPRKSVVVAAPMQAGELQILKLAPNGTAVKAGDVVLQFDGSTLKRTIQESQSELRQAMQELDQAKAQARITNGQDNTALLHSQYDVDRAKLEPGLQGDDIVSKMDSEKAKLALADAEQRLRESHVKESSNRQSARRALRRRKARSAKCAPIWSARRSHWPRSRSRRRPMASSAFCRISARARLWARSRNSAPAIARGLGRRCSSCRI